MAKIPPVVNPGLGASAADISLLEYSSRSPSAQTPPKGSSAQAIEARAAAAARATSAQTLKTGPPSSMASPLPKSNLTLGSDLAFPLGPPPSGEIVPPLELELQLAPLEMRGPIFTDLGYPGVEIIASSSSGPPPLLELPSLPPSAQRVAIFLGNEGMYYIKPSDISYISEVRGGTLQDGIIQLSPNTALPPEPNLPTSAQTPNYRGSAVASRQIQLPLVRLTPTIGTSLGVGIGTCSLPLIYEYVRTRRITRRTAELSLIGGGVSIPALYAAYWIVRGLNTPLVQVGRVTVVGSIVGATVTGIDSAQRGDPAKGVIGKATTGAVTGAVVSVTFWGVVKVGADLGATGGAILFGVPGGIAGGVIGGIGGGAAILFGFVPQITNLQNWFYRKMKWN